MMKLVVLTALVAYVAADGHVKAGQSLDKDARDLTKSISQNEKDLESRDEEAADANDTMGTLYDTLNDADLGAVDTMASDAAEVLGIYTGAKDAASDALDRAAAAQEAAFAAAEVELEALMAKFEATKEQAIHAAAVKADNSASVETAALTAAGNDLSGTTDALKARIAQHTACSKTGKVWNGVACSEMKTPPAMQKVHHRMFNNADGRDSGYVSNRYLKFAKKEDATYMRIWYHDNFRVHGHTAHAQWDVMICDANGNGCAECKDPGKVQHWRYSNHQHNWWMNDHWSTGTFGLCKKSDNRDLKKGTYQLKVRIDSNRYDIYTGHNQHNMLMVDEVFKA